MNKEESKTIPLRKATHKELMEVITDLHTQNYLKEMEIVRLNKERKIDIKYNKYLQKEIAKANSIINELEKYLWEERYIHNGEYVFTGKNKAEEIYTMILDKLQELKGSDKE